ncbi:MAG: hypothetical protein KDD64_17445, partial [Bdellovibrionales bacterium]|nr:hypothetical protein [Bdellovibrionales bacterium]
AGELVGFSRTASSLAELSNEDAPLWPVQPNGDSRVIAQSLIEAIVVAQIDEAVMSCPVDLNHDHTACVADILQFLTPFFAQEEAADFDVSGHVTPQDIFAFLSLWFLECWRLFNLVFADFSTLFGLSCYSPPFRNPLNTQVSLWFRSVQRQANETKSAHPTDKKTKLKRH